MGVIGETNMTWFITHKPAYDADFVELPKSLQRDASRAHADLAQDPITPRGKRIKPLRSWENVWRYRLGNHRLIYSALPEKQVIQLLAIGPRRDVYRRFKYDPEAEPLVKLAFSAELAAGLEPTQEGLPEWMAHPEWYQSKAPQSDPLPKKLTPSRLNRWRIPQEYHGGLIRCRTEDDLAEADVPDWVLGRVMDALWPPDVQQIARQPDQLLVKPEDLERYAEGTLRGFLLHLDDSQRRYTDWALAGPTLVKGGPGSGKSTVALYRARALLEHALESNEHLPEMLFTTYTNALTNFSESLLCQLLQDLPGLNCDRLPKAIRVTTVDKTVMWIARSSDASFQLARRAQQIDALRYARAALKPKAMGDLDKLLVSTALQHLRDGYLLQEFEWVIEGQNCRKREHYLKANRAGRAIPFNESLRSAVWALYAVYRLYLQKQELFTWGQLRQLALDQVVSDAFPRRWDYVIVDEAQDLTPVALALCVELCRDPSGLFLTADANQSLYNRGFRWRNVHEQLKVTGRTRILRRNYRSTRQIAHAGAELLAGMEGADEEAGDQEFVHAGAMPVIYAAAGAADQAHWLVEQICAAARELRLPLSGAAVLAPSNSLGQTLADLLAKQGLPARFLPSREVRLEERCVKVMTLHAAKGLEFPIVAIAHVEADRLPRQTRATDAEDIREHLDDQRRLFYVGCTRAMRHLFITYDRPIPSPFLDLLSEERWLKLG
jgi:superfamily I DNA/RNA helicase/mRNA-degrading endonuclease RelE of RelBE toxin-antitoxin system